MMRSVPRVTARTAAFFALFVAGLFAVTSFNVAVESHSADLQPAGDARGRASVASNARTGMAGASAYAAVSSALLLGSVSVDRTDDNAGASACTVAPSDCSLRGAVIFANANPGTTINVPAGTYQLTVAGNGEQLAATGDLDIRASGTSIVGAGAATTIIRQTTNDRVLDINPGTLVIGFGFNLSGVTITGGNLPSGSGGGMLSGGNGAATTIANCIFDNNKATGTLAANGGAITDSTAVGSTTLTVTDSTFSNNSTATGQGGAIRFNSPGALTIQRTLFANNSALSNSAGAVNATFTNANGIYNISQSAFENNHANGGASRGGAILVGNGTLNVRYSRFFGNTAGAGSGQAVAITGNGGITVNNNWWGQNSGPGATDVFGSLVANWLQLRLSASPNPIQTGGSTTLTADIYGNSTGGVVTAVNLLGLPPFTATFANPPPTLGTISGSPTQFVNGQATATYTAGSTGGTDGVTVTADNQTVSTNVIIEQSPTITCQTDITVNAPPNSCTASVSFNTTATGAPAPGVSCQIVSSAQVITSPHVFPAGTTTVACTASNGVSPDATCTFNVTVNANQTPTVVAPPNVSTTTGAGATTCSAFVSDAQLGTATAANTCDGPVTITRSGVPSGNNFPVGMTTITYTGTDPAGHTGTATQTVTVTDNTPPTVSAPAPTSASADASCQAAIPNVVAGSSASDNCTPAGSITITQSPAAGSMVGLGPHTITVTATDGAGNSSTATTTFTVNDTTAPTLNAPGNVSVATGGLSCSAFVSNAQLGTATASDNCDSSVTVTRTGVPAGNIFPVGMTTITYTATDGFNNTTTGTQTVTVTDGTPPTITAPPPSFASANSSCQAAIPDVATGSATDNCGPVTVTQSPAAGTLVGLGPHPITITATDGAGNTSTATTTFTVNDTTGPVITLNGANPYYVECHTTFVDPGATATDNCSGNVAVVATGVVNSNVPGTYTRTYTATDAAGNTTTTTRTVIVRDSSAPTINVTAQSLELWPPNHKYETYTVASLVTSVTDSCNTSLGISAVRIASVTSDELDDDPNGGDGNTTNDMVIAADCKSVQLRAERDGNLNGRVYTITLRVTDSAGNTGTATVKVTVPKSQGNGGAAVDSGPHNSVTGNCP